MSKLTAGIQQSLIEELDVWIRVDTIENLEIVFQNQACAELREKSLRTVCGNPELVFASKDSLTLDKTLLKLLLEQNDLQIEDEVQLWEFLVNWGIAQSPNLYTD